MTASVRAVTETTIFLDNFTNVDLYFQGYYQFRTQLFYEVEEGNARVFATPMSQQFSNDLELRAKNTDQKTIQHRQLAAKPHSALSKSRAISCIGRDASPSSAPDENSFGSSFIKPSHTPSQIFKNNLSKYNESASQLQQQANGAAPFEVRKNGYGSVDTTQRLLKETDKEWQEQSMPFSQEPYTTSHSQLPEAPSLKPQHDVRRPCMSVHNLDFHSRVFYIRQSDERVDLGEMLNFKSEFEADLDTLELTRSAAALTCQENIFGTKKFYLQVQMLFKEASQTEIENQEQVKLNMSTDEATSQFQVVSTCKLLLRNTSRAGVFNFYPVTFDNGYFSSLTICVNSILKEFKFKQTPLFQELLARTHRQQLGSQSRSMVEPIDESKPIRSLEVQKDRSFAEQVTAGKHTTLSKVQIQALQEVYLQTLSHAYKQARSLCIRLLRQVKPSAYIEIQGMQSQYQSASSALAGREDGNAATEPLPPLLKVEDIYSILQQSQQESKKHLAVDQS